MIPLRCAFLPGMLKLNRIRIVSRRRPGTKPDQIEKDVRDDCMVVELNGEGIAAGVPVYQEGSHSHSSCKTWQSPTHHLLVDQPSIARTA